MLWNGNEPQQQCSTCLQFISHVWYCMLGCRYDIVAKSSAFWNKREVTVSFKVLPQIQPSPLS